MNARVRKHNDCVRDAGKTKFVKENSPAEFWVSWSVVFVARIHSGQGNSMWEKHASDGLPG